MQQIRIDFDNPGLPQSLGAVEGESQSRIFQVTLYKSGAAYTAPAGAVYSIMYRGFGPQNQGWYDTIEDGAGKRAACTVSGNVVTCELARQALRVPGHLTVVLCVTDAKGYMLKNWPIMADVRNDGYEDTGESEMYFNLSGIAGNYLTQLEKAMTDAETTRNNLISTSEQVKKDIDAKAAETLKTIPESYTELDGSVKQIKEDLESIIANTDTFVVNDTGIGHGAKRYNVKLLNGESYLVILEVPSSKFHTIFVGKENDSSDIFSQNNKNAIIEYSPDLDKDSIGFNIVGTEDVKYNFKVLHISKGSTVLDLTNYFIQQTASAVNANYVIKANGLLLISTPDGVQTTFITIDTKYFSHPFSAFINSSYYTDIVFKIDDNTGITPFPIEENKELLNKIKIFFVNKSTTDGYDISLSASDSKECAKRKSDIVLDGENDTDVLTSLMSCLDGINIFLYNGTYNVNKYWTYNNKCRCSIASWVLPANKKKRSVVLHGETMSCPTSEDGVFFKVSQELHDAWDNTKNNILLGIPYRVGEYDLSRYQIQVENINIMGIKYDKPITYVDYFLADSVALKSVNIRSWNKYPTEYKAFDDTPNLECVGIRCGHSSNFGIQNYVKNSNIWYCGKGVVNNGEHYIIEDVKVHHCYIGWVFGDRPDHGNMEHPNILLGCSTEACYQLGWLTKDGITTDISFDDAHAKNNYIRRSTLIMIGMSVENQWQIPINEITDANTADTLPFWEIVHKAYRGRIEIDLYGRNPFTVPKSDINSHMEWISYPNEN